MGRLIGSPNPGRILVLIAGTFSLSHLVGLLAWSAGSESSGIPFDTLVMMIAANLGWMFLWLFLIDAQKPGAKLLSSLLSKGSAVERAGFLVAAGLLALVAATMIPWNDEKSNLAAADYLIRNGFPSYFAHYAQINAWLGPHHPPMMPVIYAGLYALFGMKVLVGRIFAVTCSLFAIALAYYWIRRLFGRRQALAACALLPAIPLVMFSGTSSILDSPFWLLFTATLMVFDLYLDTRKTSMAAACGFLLSLCIMARYNGLMLPVIFFLILLILHKKMRLLNRAGTWLIFFVPAILLLPWVIYSALSGTFLVQFHQMAGFLLIALIPPGGGFYLKSIVLPLIPFMTGLWNIPLWFIGGYGLLKHHAGGAAQRMIMLASFYILFMILSLPNARYLLSISPILSLLTAQVVLNVEDKEGRGLQALVFLWGISVMHIVLVLTQTSNGSVYLFY